jgi:galactokinase
MAGIGWGGHLVCLVQAPEVEAFAKGVKAEYKQQLNIFPQVYIYEPQEGGREVEVQPAPGL